MTATAVRTPSVRGLAAHIDHRGGHRRDALRARLLTLLGTLGEPADGRPPTVDLLERLAAALHDPTPERVWLAHAVISGRLPSASAVEAGVRRARLDGVLAALQGVIRAPRPGWPITRGPWPRVEVITGEVLVDLHHTARTELATGIQRVARQAAQRWTRDHRVVLMGWTRDLRSLRRLTDREQHGALHGYAAPANATGDTGAPGWKAGTGAGGGNASEAVPGVVVPWHCTYVLPELMTETRRARALQGVLRYSGTAGAMIGFDCVPITSAETVAAGMGAGFAMMLSAAAHMCRMATISLAAAAEYRGWRTMLSGAGLAGPEILAISLPVEGIDPDPAAVAEATASLIDAQRPMVLCVGSHEPRKNHLAVLHAAELLWRDGVKFSLVFVGGNSWHGESFTDRLEALQSAGRPVRSITALSDDLLWAAYRLARVVVFPSLNEGFGLPVAEALASGTPVITSDFGSMAEIGAEGGALLVDPRDDHAIRDALRTLITDDIVHAGLVRAARARTVRTWEHYAADTWEYLVKGQPPLGTEPEGETES